MGCRGIPRMGLRRVVAILALCSAPIVATGCAAPPDEEAPSPLVDSAAENEAALNELVAKYMQAVNRGDADGLAVLYTEDAIRIQADGRPIVGRDDIRLFAAADYADNDWDLQLRVDESDYSGALAFVRGAYALTVTSKVDPEAEAYQEVGKWMDLMRRQEDGAWLIEREISNRDHPQGQPPAMPAEEG